MPRSKPEIIPARVRQSNSPDSICGGDLYDHVKFCLQDKLNFIVQVSALITISEIYRHGLCQR
jgi:hypothetical protein